MFFIRMQILVGVLSGKEPPLEVFSKLLSHRFIFNDIKIPYYGLQYVFGIDMAKSELK